MKIKLKDVSNVIWVTFYICKYHEVHVYYGLIFHKFMKKMCGVFILVLYELYIDFYYTWRNTNLQTYLCINSYQVSIYFLSLCKYFLFNFMCVLSCFYPYISWIHKCDLPMLLLQTYFVSSTCIPYFPCTLQFELN